MIALLTAFVLTHLEAGLFWWVMFGLTVALDLVTTILKSTQN